jgi:hypothetical protein
MELSSMEDRMNRNAFAATIGFIVMLACQGFGGWDPQALRGQDTLDFLTVGPEEGEHWSRVWLVVVDGQIYVRLGNRAAERMQKNTAAPYVKVRAAGEELERVKAEAAPEMAEKVAGAMGEKYWSDLFVRYFPHPLTMRLVPEATRP